MGKAADTAGGAASGAAAGAVLGPWGAVAGGLVGGALGYFGSGSSADDEKRKRLTGVGGQSLGFGSQANQNYDALTGRLNGSLDQLQARANGQNSISMQQLAQGQQAAMAQQRSLAASASPTNAPMAARIAANNIGRSAYGLSGQQALAGLQERAQAQQEYAQLLSNSRGQDLQGTLGGYNGATSAYAGGLNGQAQQTTAQQWAPIISSAAQTYAGTQQGGGGQSSGPTGAGGLNEYWRRQLGK